jgi:2,4-dienoyl-CoA reductase-like NADH-dependent reductase (Old Yellow Enzyme family)
MMVRSLIDTQEQEMAGTTKKILSAYDIKGATLRNRLAVAPMTRVSATADGLATDAMRRYYARFAAGGFGLVITEGLYPDSAHSQGYRNQPGLADDAQARSWTAITDDAHAHGTRVFAQLMHAGALSQGKRFRTHNVAPSALRPVGEQMRFYHGEGQYAEPVALDADGIRAVVAGFVDAALRAVRIGGFDGIEVHGANGYLLDQFLTAATNRRDDRWGGDVQGRVTLLAEVVAAVKDALAAAGAEVPVGIRISQGKVNDFTSKWPGGEADARVIFGSLAAAGADFIHVTEFEAWQPAFADGGDSLVALARRYAPDVPLIANGGLHDPARAEQVMALGADLVALGRGALANPDMPRLLASDAAPRPFDPAILGPIADVKDSELAFEPSR